LSFKELVLTFPDEYYGYLLKERESVTVEMLELPKECFAYEALELKLALLELRIGIHEALFFNGKSDE